MKFLLLTYDPQGTGGPDVVPFDDEASAFAELKRATRAKQPREEVALPRLVSGELRVRDAASSPEGVE